MKYRLLSTFLILFSLVLAGCGARSAVPLSYKPVTPKSLTCAKSIGVMEFSDERDVVELGKDEDGDKFYPASSVANWIAHSLYLELGNAGCTAAYAENGAAVDTVYVVKGKVLEASLNRTSLTDYTARIVLDVQMTTYGKKVFGQTQTTTVEKKMLPTSDAPQDVLESALGEALSTLAVKLTKTIR